MTAAPHSLAALPADRLSDQGFWRALFPALTIAAPQENFAARPLANASVALAGDRMLREGYFQAADPGLAALAAPLAQAVSELAKIGAPPVFVFLFDQAWAAFNRQTQMIASLLGPDYQVLPDFWAWHVNPQGDEAGWRPHRDRGAASLAPDKTPLTLTVWIPLNDATPDSSCMYILPADKDPTYGTPRDGQYQIDLPAIRALPGKAGDWFCWNQAVLHWGGQTSRFAEHSRMSIALEFQRGDHAPFNTPLLGTLPAPDFDARLKLVCKQILQYAHMYPLTADLAAVARRLIGT